MDRSQRREPSDDCRRATARNPVRSVSFSGRCPWRALVESVGGIRSEKEEHHFFLSKIIEHIDLNIIAFRSTGDIEIINNVAKKFFNIYSSVFYRSGRDIDS